MRASRVYAALLCFAFCAAFAQTQSTPTFEVASVKPAAPPAGRGGRKGGGPNNPGQAAYTNTTIRSLVLNAYGVKNYQVSGPSAIDTERFDIVVKVPEGATAADRKLMLQNLLAERFKLTLHRETKELPMYDLVAARNGPKMKESVEVADPTSASTAPPLPLPQPGERKLGPEGFPIQPGSGRPSMQIMISLGRLRMKLSQETMVQLADLLTNQLNRPVMDKTGLSRKYDFILEYAPEVGVGPMGLGLPSPPPPPPGDAAPALDAPPVLFNALQEQLGLKLEQKKGPVEMLVIDHVEKTPTEN
jgi:uncharacterized protein (TIGR03435 family)